MAVFGLTVTSSNSIPRSPTGWSNICACSISIATGENLFSLPDARNLIRHGDLRPDRDVLQFDPALSYGLVEYLRVLEMLRAHGWAPARRGAPGGPPRRRH